MATSEDMTHEEIWDDSALLDSWNEAVEEYKHYHSLHARGEKVEEVLRQVDEEGLEAVVLKQAANDIDMDGGAQQSAHNVTGVTSNALLHDADGAAQAEVAADATRGGRSMNGLPQAVLPPGHDEGMRNLMMSWYYAGYYTGLHEGRQQALQAAASTSGSGAAS